MKLALIESTQGHDRACGSNSRTRTFRTMALEHQFLQLLELPTSPAASRVFLSPKFQAHFSSEKIHGVVRPDLPSRSQLAAILSTDGTVDKESCTMKRQTSPSHVFSASEQVPVGAVDGTIQRAGCWQVQTVAAQLRSMRDIRNRLITSSQSLDATGRGGSLLLVSGGHPLTSLSHTSFDLLGMASKLRQHGEIPSGIQLWAVENPLINTVERLQQKIFAGAETVILQPPLLRHIFRDWWDVAHGRGLMEKVRVVVGLPLITSADNLAFWFGLTRTSGNSVDLRLAELRKVDATHSMGVQARSAFYKEETLHLIKFIKNLPGVAGIHFMPVTPSGWRQFAALQEQNL